MVIERPEDSPIASTVDKYLESYYFINSMLSNYHDHYAFRFNLNAFIQALRNITWMLQSESNRPDTFAEWYATAQESMKTDDLLRRFVNVRNLIVKQEMLSTKSKAYMGIFRGRKLKLAVGGEVPVFFDTLELLEKAKKFIIGFMLDEAHSVIGEQVGVQREWVVEAIGDEEVVTLCTRALLKIGDILKSAHSLYGVEFDQSLNLPHISNYQVILESDIKPTLPEQWGW